MTVWYLVVLKGIGQRGCNSVDLLHIMVRWSILSIKVVCIKGFMNCTIYPNYVVKI